MLTSCLLFFMCARQAELYFRSSILLSKLVPTYIQHKCYLGNGKKQSEADKNLGSQGLEESNIDQHFEKQKQIMKNFKRVDLQFCARNAYNYIVNKKEQIEKDQNLNRKVDRKIHNGHLSRKPSQQERNGRNFIIFYSIKV